MAESRGMGSQSDLGSHVNLRPTVSWLWQQDFTSIIQIPKQRQSALCQLQPAGPCLQGGTWRGSADRKKEANGVEPNPQWMKPSVNMNQSRSQSHFDPSKTLSGCNCCHSLDTETHLHLTVQSGFLNRQRALFLMIMQILFNGYRCHLHLVYCPDSLWHNFDSTGGSTTPKRSSLSADSRTDNTGYSS